MGNLGSLGVRPRNANFLPAGRLNSPNRQKGCPSVLPDLVEAAGGGEGNGGFRVGRDGDADETCVVFTKSSASQPGATSGASPRSRQWRPPIRLTGAPVVSRVIWWRPWEICRCTTEVIAASTASASCGAGLSEFAGHKVPGMLGKILRIYEVTVGEGAHGSAKGSSENGAFPGDT